MSDKAYYRDNDDRDPYDNYDLLRGPDGFQCLLTEPEDRTWGRDGSHVVKELNRLHADLAAERDLVQRLAGTLSSFNVGSIYLSKLVARLKAENTAANEMVQRLADALHFECDPYERDLMMAAKYGLRKVAGKWERVK